MRPYQIYAVKAIMDCVHQNRGNGYIWHTTGSGKTLTSFKASTLMKDNPDIDKCLFVVDRKDLDRQTREEFNKFQENCVEENTNTETLVRRMLSDDYADKVIVTTIQKLGIALDPKHKKNYQERLKPLKNKRIVFILMNAIVPSSDIIIRQSKSFSRNLNYSVLRGLLFSRKIQHLPKSTEKKAPIKQRQTFSRKNCMLIQSPTQLMIIMSCVFMSIISNRKEKTNPKEVPLRNEPLLMPY